MTLNLDNAILYQPIYKLCKENIIAIKLVNRFT